MAENAGKEKGKFEMQVGGSADDYWLVTSSRRRGPTDLIEQIAANMPD